MILDNFQNLGFQIIGYRGDGLGRDIDGDATTEAQTQGKNERNSEWSKMRGCNLEGGKRKAQDLVGPKPMMAMDWETGVWGGGAGWTSLRRAETRARLGGLQGGDCFWAIDPAIDPASQAIRKGHGS